MAAVSNRRAVLESRHDIDAIDHHTVSSELAHELPIGLCWMGF